MIFQLQIFYFRRYKFRGLFLWHHTELNMKVKGKLIKKQACYLSEKLFCHGKKWYKLSWTIWCISWCIASCFLWTNIHLQFSISLSRALPLSKLIKKFEAVVLLSVEIFQVFTFDWVSQLQKCWHPFWLLRGGLLATAFHTWTEIKFNSNYLYVETNGTIYKNDRINDIAI